MSLTLCRRLPPLPAGAASNLQSNTIGGHVRFDKLAVEHKADLDQVRTHPQDIEAKRREMRRHQPARFVTVGNDHRLDSERIPELILEIGPELGWPALGDHVAKIGVRVSSPLWSVRSQDYQPVMLLG